MDKKKNSSETTGPIRVVLFKGTQKPTTKQITEKHMIALYTIIGFLVFSLMFLVTTLLIVSHEKSDVDGKYSIAANEIIRLRKMIRNMSGYENSSVSEDVAPSTDKKKKPGETSSIFTNGNIETPTVNDNENSSEENVANEAADNSLNLNVTEKEATTSNTDPSVAALSTTMKAEISRFRPGFDATSNLFRYRFLVMNLSEANAQLEGKAVIIVKAGENYYSSPVVQLSNGNLVSSKSGILFRIQRQKEMTGQIRIPVKPTDIKEATIILNDLNGVEIIRRVFTITNP
jgi:hypothetical protein